MAAARPPTGALDRHVDLEESVVHFRRGCELGHGEACAYLGSAYRYGEGVVASERQALEHLRRACTLDSAAGCVSTADMLREDIDEQALRSLLRQRTRFERILDLYGQACRLELEPACVAGRRFAEITRLPFDPASEAEGTEAEPAAPSDVDEADAPGGQEQDVEG